MRINTISYAHSFLHSYDMGENDMGDCIYILEQW